MRALVTGALSPSGRSVVAQLLERGIAVVAVDSSPATADMPLPVHVLPLPITPERVTALRQLARREKVDLIIPTLGEELPGLAAARSAFGSAIEVVVAGPGPVSIAHDKLFAAWQLRARGVPTPPFGAIGDFASAEAAFAALGGPLIVKPRERRANQATPRLYHRPADVDWDGLSGDHFVQRFIPGTEYSLVTYRPSPGQSVDRLVVVLERTALGDDASQLRRLGDSEAPDVSRVALAAVRAVGLVGPVHVLVRRDPDGNPQVLDIDARFGTASADVPELLTRVLLSANHRSG
ncbi:ATP-grasp domain-containing protein [Luteipulveratus halotolerans]|uniref:ATP-grasp domain-containing protein n=1 Tax=Luteipulveratus halotolerans TaxID=1631356 RepID=A0A0L6CKC6_9MICO|nr:hypothetical protein [Luteipulveratus halotolerans]KNX38256.1 hypothetical protein VV01_15685 [Luteipulveratus halotolerans]